MRGSRKILKKFRRRFVAIAMALVASISILAFGLIGVLIVDGLYSEVDNALEASLKESSLGSIPQLGYEGSRSGSSSLVPCFCVNVYSDGSIVPVANQAVTMDEDVLVTAVSLVMNGGERQGDLSPLGLSFELKNTSFGCRIAFADVTRVRSLVHRQVFVMVATWLVLMLVMLSVTWFLSRVVTKPVERAWENQQRFIADASHELKTPLTVILANASILKSSPEKTVASQEGWVDGIQYEAERMKSLTEDLLILARDDAGVPGAASVDFDLSQAVSREILQFEAVAFERGMTIHDEVEPGLVVHADPQRVGNALNTLLENACKYGESQVWVTLEESPRGHALLSVANDGSAIPPEDLPHVFDRFYKSDKSRTREGEAASFGLGLSIAKSAVEHSGGSMKASSKTGQTVFSASLPLARRAKG